MDVKLQIILEDDSKTYHLSRQQNIKSIQIDHIVVYLDLLPTSVMEYNKSRLMRI